jgi:hypothetical protein
MSTTQQTHSVYQSKSSEANAAQDDSNSDKACVELHTLHIFTHNPITATAKERQGHGNTYDGCY